MRRKDGDRRSECIDSCVGMPSVRIHGPFCFFYFTLKNKSLGLGLKDSVNGYVFEINTLLGSTLLFVCFGLSLGYCLTENSRHSFFPWIVTLYFGYMYPRQVLLVRLC